MKFDSIAYNITDKRDPIPEDSRLYVGLEHMDSGSLYVTRYGLDVDLKGSKLIMHKGDVLLGKRNAYLRRAAIAPHDGLFSAHGMILRPKEEVIDRNYFPFFIASDRFFDEVIRISVGGLSPTVNWKDLRNLDFELPSLAQQKVLADKLWAAYRLKESYKKLLFSTEEMVKSQFIEDFRDKNPNGCIREMVETDIKSVKKSFNADDTIQYIDISSIDAVSHSIKETTIHIVKSAPSRAQQCVKYGDILVSTVRPINRNIAVVTNDAANLVASTGFCILRPKENFREYLLSVTTSDKYTETMCDKASGGLYPAVNNSDVLSYKVYIPDGGTLKKVSALYNQADKSEFELRKSIDAIDSVIKSLINN